MSEPDPWSALPALTGDLVAVLDARGRIEAVNDALARACGSGMVGRPAAALLAPEADDAARAAWTEHLRDEPASDIEVPLAAQGRVLWGRLRSRRAGAHQLLVIRDVTELRQQRQRAEHMAELLDLVLEFGRLGLWERDAVTGEGHWDHHMHRLFGIEPLAGAPHIDRFLERLMPGDQVQQAYYQSLREDGRYRWRYRQRQSDGTVRHYESSWEVKGRRVFGVVRDDTEAHDLARAFDTSVAGLRLAVDLGNIAFWRQDLNAQRLHLDERGHALLQLAPHAQGHTLEEFRALTHPDDLAPAIEATRRAVETGQPVDLQLRMRRADGQWRHLATRRVLRRDERGAPQALHGVMVDLTDQFDATRRTIELARRLDVTVQALGVGLWSRAAGSREWSCNPQMHAIHGLAPDAPAPSLRGWLRCVAPADRARVRREALAWLRGDAARIDTEYRVAGGDARWVHLTAQRQPDARLDGIALDVTARHQAEAALRAATDRVALAARAAGIGTWELDLATGQAWWDEQMFRLRGRSEVAGWVSLERGLGWIHPDDRDSMLRERRASVAQQRRSHFEFRVVWPDGQQRWLATQSMVEADAQGVPQRQVGINWDVTEAHQARAALQAQRESEAQRSLFARLSHELRTPLNAVLGFTQLLRANWAEQADPAARAQLDEVHRAGAQLLALVDDVLELAQREPPAPAAGAPARRLEGRLLYIEDNPVNLMLVEALVQQRTALELRGCATGREGVALARDWQPDLILVDMQLPDIDGYAVLAELRAQPETAGIRCVALSANAMPQDIERALAAGYAAYWTKPIDIDRFVAGLSALLL